MKKIKNNLKFITFSLLIISIMPLNFLYGGKWEVQVSGTKNKLIDVHFIDINNGWAVGNRGTILHTKNGGISWISQSLNEESLISKIYIVNSKGWVIFGSTLSEPKFTVDRGNTWKRLSGLKAYFLDICFFGTECGWITSVGSTLLKTTNGGENWKAYDNVAYIPPYIFFTNCTEGWGVGNKGTISHSTNGGLSWSSQNSGTKENLWDLYFTDKKIGWVVGNNGIILHTKDGGKNWSLQMSRTKKNLKSISFIDLNNGWVVGDDGIILKTTNGGDTWEMQPIITNSDLFDVQFINRNCGWIVGSDGIIIHYTD